MYQTNYQSYLITGSDASVFLQGQFSCDIEEVNQSPQAGAYCLPDGKVLAFFYLCKIADGYLLITSDPNAEAFLKRLKMFMLRADIQIEEANYKVVGYKMENSKLSQSVICIPLNQNLCLCVNKDDALEANTTDDTQQWRYFETLNGIPALNDELRGKFILPFLNLDWLGAVSYQKGCYVGQEIIARLHYRSKPAKRSYVYTGEIGLSDLPLAEIITCADGEGKPCRVTPVRIALWQDKLAIMVEMAIRNAPRETLVINHNNQDYRLACEPQPYLIEAATS